MTMLRFEPDQKVGNREYKRTEGTRAYFFSLDCVKNLFKGVGFVEVHILLLFHLPPFSLSFSGVLNIYVK